MLRPVPPPPPARRAAKGSLLVVLVVLALLLLAAAARPPGAGAASMTVTRTPTGAAIPRGFLGISTETYDLPAFAGDNPQALDPAFIGLLHQIAPAQGPVLRLGGDSTDWSWFPVAGQRKPPGVTYTLTRRWLDLARNTARALHGKLILGVNLEADNPAIAAGDARAMLRTIGRRNIEAIEIGNEPELYHHFAWYHTASGVRVVGRPATWSESQYRAEFARFAHAMGHAPIAGPVSGTGEWLDQLGTFLHDEPSVSLATIHAYPLKQCTPQTHITIPDLLSDSASDGFVAQVTPYVRVAQAHHTPIRIDELNAISCGGTRGVSDSFASALWMVNTLFGLAHTGVGGVNVHMTPGKYNAILDPVGSGSPRAIAVQPEYYAMMLFAQAAPSGARILTLRHTGLPAGEQAWATRDRSGTIRVVLIDKSAHRSATTTLRIRGVAGPAAVESLRARSLAATEGVTLGGQTFGVATSTGQLTGTPQTRTVSPVRGRYTVTVPAASAEMLTLHAPAGALLVSALTVHRLLAPLAAGW